MGALYPYPREVTDYIASLRRSQEQGGSAPFCDFMTAELIANLQQEVLEHRASIEGDVPWASE